MTALTNGDRHGRPALRISAAVFVLLALCAVSVLAVPGPDSASAARAKLIGKAKGKARSGCPTPENECQAVGRLTGFQTRATGAKNPFVVRKSGTLVGWSVDLTGRPKPSQRRAFGKLYRHKRLGTAPTARIAILKKRRGKKYDLKSQSPLVDLTDHIGERPIITLNNPLRINKGDIVALTIPTWLSSFTVGVPARQNAWRASRAGNACEVGTSGVPKQNLKKSKPQENEDSSRSYGCAYRGARLLYWGYYVPGS